jgi:hypothetical protein
MYRRPAVAMAAVGLLIQVPPSAYASVLMLRSSRSRACPMQVGISCDNTSLDDAARALFGRADWMHLHRR